MEGSSSHKRGLLKSLYCYFVYALYLHTCRCRRDIWLYTRCIPTDIHAVLTYGTEPAALRYTAISHVYECDIAYIYILCSLSHFLYFYTFIMFFCLILLQEATSDH